MDESESCDGSTASFEDRDPREDMGAGDAYILQWVEGAKGVAMTDGGWEPAVINDDQLGDYAEE
jgi:hypothetical protein